MTEKEDFIGKWRIKLGCGHDPHSTNLCWCETCTALEKLWRDAAEIRESDSEDDIRKEFWRYVKEKEWYIYLLREGDSVSISNEELDRLSTYFFPSRYAQEQSSEPFKNIAYISYDIGLMRIEKHKNKIFLVVRKPEVELSEIDIRGKVIYLYAKSDDLDF